MHGKHHPPIEITEKVLSRFQRSYRKAGSDECWNWQASISPTGYGCFRHSKRSYRAHRVSYQLATGVYPGKLLVCHSCDNPSCVNPSHLWLGTHDDNQRDKLAKGRHRNGITGTIANPKPPTNNRNSRKKILKPKPHNYPPNPVCGSCGHWRSDDYIYLTKKGRIGTRCRECNKRRCATRHASQKSATNR